MTEQLTRNQKILNDPITYSRLIKAMMMSSGRSSFKENTACDRCGSVDNGFMPEIQNPHGDTYTEFLEGTKLDIPSEFDCHRSMGWMFKPEDIDFRYAWRAFYQRMINPRFVCWQCSEILRRKNMLNDDFIRIDF